MTTNKTKEILYPELSFEIVGACFDVHNELGRFGREKQYSDLLARKLAGRGLKYAREVRMGDSGNIVDFVVEDRIALELKAVRTLTRDYYRQIKNYLEQSHLDLGILVNFSDVALHPKRVLRATNESALHSQQLAANRNPHRLRIATNRFDSDS